MEISVTPASVNATRMQRDCAVMCCTKDASTKETSAGGDTVSISPLGRALAAAVARADAATKDLGRAELRSLVERTRKTVHNEEWHRDAKKLATELPQGADAGRADIAQKAVKFIERLTTLPRPPGLERDNPFYGLSRAELAAIEYDETGSFTMNERRAASSEAGRQYGEWSVEVCARARDESARTGKTTHFYREILAYFEALPAIEQVALPDGYMDRLRAEVAAGRKDDTNTWTTWLTMGAPPHS